ncbi:hypothetical protein OUZ56_003831 [Daphnia magna]|uniref:Uncharacterized protein n=1 Tax=Daphnia magna TaxID=35525 RepID=A0ABQ9YMX9_9CRUS|nr:hypothetical protein OUZ56_003831 [Daphnia magna]
MNQRLKCNPYLLFWRTDSINCVQLRVLQIPLDFNIHLAWKSSSRHLLSNYVSNDVKEVNIIPIDASDGEETPTKKQRLF